MAVRPSEHREDIGSEVVAILVEPAAGGVNDLPRVMAHHELGLGQRAAAPSLSLSRGGACGGGHARCTTLVPCCGLPYEVGGEGLCIFSTYASSSLGQRALLIEQRHDTQPSSKELLRVLRKAIAPHAMPSATRRAASPRARR